MVRSDRILATLAVPQSSTRPTSLWPACWATSLPLKRRLSTPQLYETYLLLISIQIRCMSACKDAQSANTSSIHAFLACGACTHRCRATAAPRHPPMQPSTSALLFMSVMTFPIGKKCTAGDWTCMCRHAQTRCTAEHTQGFRTVATVHNSRLYWTRSAEKRCILVSYIGSVATQVVSVTQWS